MAAELCNYQTPFTLSWRLKGSPAIAILVKVP